MILSFDFELYQFCKFQIGSFFKHNQDVVDIPGGNLPWSTTLMDCSEKCSSPLGHEEKLSLCIGQVEPDMKEAVQARLSAVSTLLAKWEE